MTDFDVASTLRHDEEAPLLETHTHTIPNTNNNNNNTEPHIIGKRNIAIMNKGRTMSSMSTELTGYILMLTTALVFGTSNILIHIAQTKSNFPAVSTLFIRALIHSILTCTYFVLFQDARKSILNMTRQQSIWIILRGIIGALCIICLYTALDKIPVGDTTAIFFLSPAFTMILSHIFLHEYVTLVDISAVLLSLLGAFMITRPNAIDLSSTSTLSVSFENRIIGSLLAGTAAFSAASVYTIIHSLGTTFHFMTSVFSLAICSLILSTILKGYLSFSQLINYGWSAFAIVISALLTFISQMTLTTGLQRCRAGAGVLVNTIEVPYAYVLGLIMLHETISPMRVIGALLIVIAAVTIGARQIVKAFRAKGLS